MRDTVGRDFFVRKLQDLSCSFSIFIALVDIDKKTKRCIILSQLVKEGCISNEKDDFRPCFV